MSGTPTPQRSGGATRAAALFVVVVLGTFGPLLASPDAQSATGPGGVVVVHADNSVHTECVRIPADGAKALTLLDKTTFDLYTQVFTGLGRAVCWLDGEGVTPPDCFDFATNKFWGFYVQKRGQSKPHFQETSGVSTTVVDPGAILYFEYAAGDPNNNFEQPPPPVQKLGEICG